MYDEEKRRILDLKRYKSENGEISIDIYDENGKKIEDIDKID